eukprot:23031-Pleurochrysis_carterae.AAC.2
MPHAYDACSAKYRDDPVRAAIERRANAEMAQKRQAEAAARASQILKSRLEAGMQVSLFPCSGVGHKWFSAAANGHRCGSTVADILFTSQAQTCPHIHAS